MGLKIDSKTIKIFQLTKIMEIEIVDPLKKLSKNQKQKIKGSFKDGKTIQDILNQIHYTEETFRYKDLRVENVSEKLTRLTFKETSHLEDLRNKLRNKLQNQSTVRNNAFKNDAWKMYHQVMEHPAIRCLPDDTIKKAIPNPDDVKKNADSYRMMNAVNPNPMLKQYFELCLSSD